MDTWQKMHSGEIYDGADEDIAREQTLCLDGKDASFIRGKRVLVVDDVISTGDSLLAMETLVKEAGGEIAAKMAVLAEGAAADRDDIIVLAPLPLFNPDGTVKA